MLECKLKIVGATRSQSRTRNVAWFLLEPILEGRKYKKSAQFNLSYVKNTKNTQLQWKAEIWSGKSFES